jgi:TonB-dependent SusC/RagA subfamily outer membrane receptor
MNKLAKRSSWLVVLVLISIGVGYAQQTTQKGVVKDLSGLPLIGATVQVKGSSIGTITDNEGKFNLIVNSEDIITVSYIGYESQEIKVQFSKILLITLKDDTKKLNEVVVVGFGTQKKVNLTGSVGVVNADALESRPVQNALQALEGVSPGLNISYTNGGALNAQPEINIRGIATIGQGSTGSALVLIDGMEGDLASINPQDIESISILKDAAASSIYGSRAPFGVILVTTKQSKGNKTIINYDFN